jgi:hypothetical protein
VRGEKLRVTSGATIAFSSQGSTYVEDFAEVQASEVRWLNEAAGDRELLIGPSGKPAGDRASIMAHAPVQGRGIALSGGGIRSAAFALGAMQAIDQKLGDAETGTGGLRRFHYISSVSGGGYMGAAVRLGMEKNGGAFPFSTIGDRADNAAVGHIRNHSRYLIPGGLKDVIGCLVVLLRGFAVNATLVLAGLLIAAGLTGLFNPNQQAFATPDVLGWEWFPSEAVMKPLLTPLGSFAYTKLLLLLGVVALAAWGIRRSLSRECDEFEGFWFWSLYAWLATVAAAALFELQPFAVAGLFYSSDAAASPTTSEQSLLGAITAALSRLSVYLAPLTAAAAVASRLFGDAVKAGMADHSVKSMAGKAVAVLAMLFVSLALPLILWIIYLNLTLWTDIGFMGRPGWLQWIIAGACGRPDIGSIDTGLSAAFPPSPGLNDACQAPRLIAWLFVATGFVLFAVTWLLRPNANSLHRLYRDRLSKAFLFDPRTAMAKSASEPTPCGHMRLNDIKPSTGPLPLINCALNVQGSRAVNRRGRNADFFFFSPVFTGSSATGFVRTEAVNAKKRPLIPDIGTAVAVSGAAASSNMGGNTVRGLAPTLALLNIRLGYWIDNPRRLCRDVAQRPPIWERLLGLYLVAEMFSLLDERAAQVYLTDREPRPLRAPPPAREDDRRRRWRGRSRLRLFILHRCAAFRPDRSRRAHRSRLVGDPRGVDGSGRELSRGGHGPPRGVRKAACRRRRDRLWRHRRCAHLRQGFDDGGRERLREGLQARPSAVSA